MKRSVRNSLVVLMLLGLFGPDAPAQQPAQPATLWNFLGIPQGMRKVRGSVANRRGNHPGLEGRLPMRALNDPANLAEDMPAVVRKGAEVKIAEDLKRQKIKAIKYLASIGCGCYDLDGSITQAMVEALGDCTEDVRLAAVQAIGEAAEGKCCANCGQSCCCKEPIVKKLASMAYERDDHGCWIEPSARVRQAAARALMICCPDTSPVAIEPVETPEPLPQGEKPEGTAPDADESDEQSGTDDADAEAGADESGTDDADEGDQDETPSLEELEDQATAVPAPVIERRKLPQPHQPTLNAGPSQLPPVINSVTAPLPQAIQSPAPVLSAQPPLPSQTVGQTVASRDAAGMKVKLPVETSVSSASSDRFALPGTTDEGYGVVVALQPTDGMAHVHFAQREKQVPVGTRLTVYRRVGRSHQVVGRVEVQASFAGCSNVRPLDVTGSSMLRQGDVVAVPMTTVSHQP